MSLEVQEQIDQMNIKIGLLAAEVNDLAAQLSEEEDELVVQQLQIGPTNDHYSDSDEQVGILGDTPPGYLGDEYDNGVLRAYADPSDADDGLEWEYDDVNNFVKLNHKDTSSVSDTSNTGGYVLQDLTFDTFGHVLTVSSVDLDSRYVQLGGNGLVPPGGLKYQQLTKDSNTDYDYKWDWTRGHA